MKCIFNKFSRRSFLAPDRQPLITFFFPARYFTKSNQRSWLSVGAILIFLSSGCVFHSNDKTINSNIKELTEDGEIRLANGHHYKLTGIRMRSVAETQEPDGLYAAVKIVNSVGPQQITVDCAGEKAVVHYFQPLHYRDKYTFGLLFPFWWMYNPWFAKVTMNEMLIYMGLAQYEGWMPKTLYTQSTLAEVDFTQCQAEIESLVAKLTELKRATESSSGIDVKLCQAQIAYLRRMIYWGAPVQTLDYVVKHPSYLYWAPGTFTVNLSRSDMGRSARIKQKGLGIPSPANNSPRSER